MSSRTSKSLLDAADISVVVRGGGMLVNIARSGLVKGAEVVTCMQALTTQAAEETGAILRRHHVC